MSAFICKDETISTIADFIAAQLNHGFNYTGISAEFHAFNDCRDSYGDYSARKIFEKLGEENTKATNGRYSRNEVFAGKYTDTNTIKPRAISKSWYIVLFKMVQCFAYQLDEDATASGAIFKELLTLEHHLASAIVCSLPEYNKTEWG